MDLEAATADDYLPISDDLDQNGFPVAAISSEDNSDNDAAGDPPVAAVSEIHSSFASDFFSCGTDWSCLQGIKEKEGKEKNNLVQRDLFHMWGMEKPSKSSGHGAPPPTRQRDLFQMWGIEKPPLKQSMRQGMPSPPRKRSRMMAGGVAEGGDAGISARSVSGRGNGGPRLCPFYKKMPGTPFTVDAFRYGLIEGCSAYFLSHFHYDHYGGLSKRWSHGPIYCTPLTARLVKMCLSVNPIYIFPLELDTEYVIDGVNVTMVEANHCPGAALIHFCLEDGSCYLHTGDFRACKMMQSHPLLVKQHINVLYLDTTYCNPKYRFPPKEDVVNFVLKTTSTFLARQPKTLIVVGAYSIGKEHVYVAISQALRVPIYTDASRRRILQLFGWPDLSGKICSSGQNSPLHVLPLSVLRFENLKEYLKTYKQHFAAILAFRPTGWTYSENTGNNLELIKPTSKGNVTIYGVPYSEHSSFTELKEFVKFLRPDKIIPTVNISNAASRDKMHSYFREWQQH